MRGANTMLPGKLLDAAEAVVVRQGIANLTLDAVAAEAGMSKGGLLHHFPTKDRLVEALVAEDGLPPGVGETIAAAIDGLWLDWVLGLAPVNQEVVVRVRIALEDMLGGHRS